MVLSHPITTYRIIKVFFRGGGSFQRFNSPWFPFYNSRPCCSRLVSRCFTFAEWIGVNRLSPKYFEYYVESSQYLFGVKFDLSFPLTFNRVMFVLTLVLLSTAEELNSCGPHESVKVIPHRWWVKTRASCTEHTMSIFMGKQANKQTRVHWKRKIRKRKIGGRRMKCSMRYLPLGHDSLTQTSSIHTSWPEAKFSPVLPLPLGQ